MNQTACRYALLAILSIAGYSSAQAVVPFRAPEDEQPSFAARAHMAACRDSARQILTQRAGELARKSGRQLAFDRGRIESESYVQRGEAEYFRFLLRVGDNEIFVVCDGHTGAIRRQIDLWREL